MRADQAAVRAETRLTRDRAWRRSTHPLQRRRTRTRPSGQRRRRARVQQQAPTSQVGLASPRVGMQEDEFPLHRWPLFEALVVRKALPFPTTPTCTSRTPIHPRPLSTFAPLLTLNMPPPPGPPTCPIPFRACSHRGPGRRLTPPAAPPPLIRARRGRLRARAFAGPAGHSLEYLVVVTRVEGWGAGSCARGVTVQTPLSTRTATIVGARQQHTAQIMKASPSDQPRARLCEKRWREGEREREREREKGEGGVSACPALPFPSCAPGGCLHSCECLFIHVLPAPVPRDGRLRRGSSPKGGGCPHRWPKPFKVPLALFVITIRDRLCYSCAGLCYTRFLAQLAERRARYPRVLGSNPTFSIMHITCLSTAVGCLK